MHRQRAALLLGVAIAFGFSPSLHGSRPALAQVPAAAPARQNEIPGVLAAGTALELVQDGFGYLDGPAAGPDGLFYFSDVGVGQTHRILRDGTIEVFRDQSNGSTGLGFDGRGRLIALESIPGRVVAIDNQQHTTVLAESPKGSDNYYLNDLIVDRGGGVYFTDPAPSSQGGDTRASRVLYIKPGGQTVVITNTLKRPTGIMLTVDGKTLLIADSDSPSILAMDVQTDGTAVNPRPWLQLKNIPPGRTGTAEGMAVDSEDRLYVATAVGVQVYSRTGEYLGVITVPR
jgi:gluconolactonase